jgi:predicted MFS family arabinose efflux permease
MHTEQTLTDPPAAAEHRTIAGIYKGWVLFLIFLAMASNYADRSIIGVVGPALKLDLRLSDAQIGLLGGTGFALLYICLGIPLARLAERYSRVWILSATLVIWSGMTMLCGAAQSFLQLFLFRVGVGVGEAGATPPSLSLIGDYFTPQRRASAVSIWSLGNATGVFLGVIAGGWLTQHLGWREAFVLVGAPGIILAAIIRFTMAEPPRGHSDLVGRDEATPSLIDAMRILFRKPAYVHIAIAGGIANFAIQAIGLFAVSYYVRRFHVSLVHVAAFSGTLAGVATGIGTLGGGVLSDWAGRHDRRWYAWLPAIVVSLAAPLYAVGFLQSSWLAAVGVIASTGAVLYLFHAPYVALALNFAPPKARATAAAILVLFASTIGLGLGPAVVGWLSDEIAARSFHIAAVSFASACPHGIARPGASADIRAACVAASAAGLQKALLATTVMFLWSGLHFLLASRHVRRDFVAPPA